MLFRETGLGYPNFDWNAHKDNNIKSLWINWQLKHTSHWPVLIPRYRASTLLSIAKREVLGGLVGQQVWHLITGYHLCVWVPVPQVTNAEDLSQYDPGVKPQLWLCLLLVNIAKACWGSQIRSVFIDSTTVLKPAHLSGCLFVNIFFSLGRKKWIHFKGCPGPSGLAGHLITGCLFRLWVWTPPPPPPPNKGQCWGPVPIWPWLLNGMWNLNSDFVNKFWKSSRSYKKPLNSHYKDRKCATNTNASVCIQSAGLNRITNASWKPEVLFQILYKGSKVIQSYDHAFKTVIRSHGGRVVILSLPTSEAEVCFPARPQVGKLVVAYRWSAVYSTEPWPTVCTWFPLPFQLPVVIWPVWTLSDSLKHVHKGGLNPSPPHVAAE